MTAPFVAQLRTARAPLEIGGGSEKMTLRVESAELWNALRVIASPDTQVEELKARVVAAMYPAGQRLDQLVLKLRGWEMLDERQTLGAAGIVEGSIVLLSYRRRRPVR
ncbi:MAG TPA: hypothetical protein VFT29_15485 [Gemmatimonadaceae bacterium]|nr:hypothetical protein [Gemmatimonadaceae bacterium]